MTTRHWLFLLLAGLVGSPRAVAQEAVAEVAPEVRNQSHLPIPLSLGSPDAAQLLLAQRLRHAEDMAGLQKMLNDPAFRKLAAEVARDPRRFGVEDQVKQLGQARPDLKDPRWQKLVASVLRRQEEQPEAGTAIPPKELEDWQQRLQRVMKDADAAKATKPEPEFSGSQAGPASAAPMPAPGAQPPAPPGAPQGGTDSNQGQPPSAEPAPSPPPPDLRAHGEGTASELLKFADRVQNSDSSLKKSPALHYFIRKLSRYAESPGTAPSGPAGHLPARLRDRIPELVRSLHLDRPLHGDPEAWRRARSLLPPAPHVALHPERFPGVSPPNWSAARAPRAEAVGSPGQFVLLLAVVLGFGALLVRLLAWQRARRGNDSFGAWRLGPWPVNPAAVRTRAELVQAFDHLALLLLGPVARSWNHLVIAARLGEDRKADRRRAAAQLAGLYEQARYAPPGEVLADADLAAARRDLCLLAGVYAA